LDAAEKMATKYNASKKIKCVQFSEGDAVTVRVPPQDRGPCDLSRVPGVIIKASGEFYKIRTEYGLLSRQFRSDELEKYDTVAAKSEINSEDLSVITLREAAKRFNSRENEVSVCKCKSGCNTNRCKCFKSNVKCSTRCHGGNQCSNQGNKIYTVQFTIFMPCMYMCLADLTSVCPENSSTCKYYNGMYKLQ